MSKKNMLGGITLASVAGLFADLNAKLVGGEGGLWLSAFKRFLRKENPWAVVVGKEVAVIVLGKYATTAEYRNAVRQAGHKVGDWAGGILAKTTVSSTAVRLDLFEVTVRELGFAEGATRADIYRRAQDLGFAVLPAEAGLLLRLELPNQASGEQLLVGMKPLTDRDGDLCVFLLKRDVDGSWLSAHYVRADDVLDPGVRWVFGRAKSSP